ncbi:uncharacterized protein LOC119296802 [Triticum dicoccoides]|uniref:uncharacterized protein LOC119296802 n=1 Tax=Triticum dicoccoides TaxID=85692 RepID=UPI00188DD7DA|nr:uncharacterized protein LOC119296802 [Triticum dicoccoides]
MDLLQRRQQLLAINPVPAPTDAELDERATLIKIKPTCCDGWICLACRRLNEPKDNLLCKIPTFKCATRNCKGQCPGTAGMNINDCEVNGVRTNFAIRDQGPNPTCAAHALVAGMDVSIRIEGALREVTICLPLNIVDLFAKYYPLFREGVGNEAEEADRMRRIPNLLRIAQLLGVKYVCATKCVRTERVLKLKSWFLLSTATTEVDKLVRLIASGFPLLVGMRTGRCFKMTANKELYRGPNKEKNHAVLLIGVEVNQIFLTDEATGENGKVHRVLFRARDSHGDDAHKCAELTGYGGDVYLLPEDLGSHVFGFHLEIPSYLTVAP